MATSFYSLEELHQIGFASCGDKVLISRKCSIYSPAQITLGSNVRIDDFCILSGKISLGNNIHISAFSALYGGGGIIMDDYTGLSPRCTLLSATDDFSGNFLIGPHLEQSLTNAYKDLIKLNKYVQLGANTIVMPGIDIGEGSVTGAMSFVNRSLDSWGIFGGVPVKKIKNRNNDLLQLL